MDLPRDLTTIPDVEYLEKPVLYQVHADLYVNLAHVSAIYRTENRVPVIRLSDGHELLVPGCDLAELARGL